MQTDQLTINEGDFWLETGCLYQWRHDNGKVADKAWTDDLTHASPRIDHIGHLRKRGRGKRKEREEGIMIKRKQLAMLVKQLAY